VSRLHHPSAGTVRARGAPEAVFESFPQTGSGTDEVAMQVVVAPAAFSENLDQLVGRVELGLVVQLGPAIRDRVEQSRFGVETFLDMRQGILQQRRHFADPIVDVRIDQRVGDDPADPFSWYWIDR
jgi:hypothetical protein